MPITLSCLSSLIKQRFSKTLLNRPSPKLRDSTDSLQRMLEEVYKLWDRLESNPIRKTRCESMVQEILILYERAKIKEKEREGQKDHKTQEFGYFVATPSSVDKDVYARLRLGRKSGAFSWKQRRNRAL